MTEWDADCAIIGAGVVGLAVARACALQGWSVIVLEQHARVGEETSSRNSEVIHSGIYYPTGSLKARLCVAGRDALYDYCRDRDIAHRQCGKLIVATDTAEEAQLELLRERAAKNAIGPVESLTSAEVQRLEPQLRCSAALWIAVTGIVSSSELMTAFVGDIENAGGTIALRTSVASVERETEGFAIRMHEEEDPLRVRTVVNATGLHASRIAAGIPGIRAESVPPTSYARGHYFTYAGRSPFSHLVYPTPVAGGLGIHATLDLGGRVRFGPDVQWIDRLDYEVPPERGEAFYASIRRYWPGLEDGKLVPSYAGIRPKIGGQTRPSVDFLIQEADAHGIAGLVNLLGIESPGLTSSMAIGDYVAERLRATAA
jgi:L-2-hydroxyglutarate oxidase LhgO